MSSPLTRRGFLVTTAAALTGCVAIPRYHPPEGEPPWPLRVPLSAIDPEQGFVVVDHGTAFPLLVFQSSDDVFTAVELVCTHRGCALHARRKRLSCPCHGSEFRLDGSVVRGPADRPLLAHTVTRDGDVLVITEGKRA